MHTEITKHKQLVLTYVRSKQRFELKNFNDREECKQRSDYFTWRKVNSGTKQLQYKHTKTFADFLVTFCVVWIPTFTKLSRRLWREQRGQLQSLLWRYKDRQQRAYIYINIYNNFVLLFMKTVRTEECVIWHSYSLYGEEMQNAIFLNNA